MSKCFSDSSSSMALVASLSPIPPQQRRTKLKCYCISQSKLIGCLEALQKTGSKKPQEQEIHDEYHYFGKSMAEQIRKLPTAFLRSKAKTEIQEILFNLLFCEPGTLTKYCLNNNNNNLYLMAIKIVNNSVIKEKTLALVVTYVTILTTSKLFTFFLAQKKQNKHMNSLMYDDIK